jgi:hypothetical protein
LSVIASVIPKSMNTALATIFAPTVLAIDPVAGRPSAVLQLYCSASSDLRTDCVVGIVTSHTPRLFCSVHWPPEPSLKEIATGVMASFVSEAHPAAPITHTASIMYFGDIFVSF